MALEPVDLVYLVTNEYDGSDEAGFAWDDALAAVPWPLPAPTPDGRPILSERDRAKILRSSSSSRASAPRTDPAAEAARPPRHPTTPHPGAPNDPRAQR
jgi:hypothetical protein